MYQFSITSLLDPLSRSAVKDHHKDNLFFFYTYNPLHPADSSLEVG